MNDTHTALIMSTYTALWRTKFAAQLLFVPWFVRGVSKGAVKVFHLKLPAPVLFCCVIIFCYKIMRQWTEKTKS